MSCERAGLMLAAHAPDTRLAAMKSAAKSSMLLGLVHGLSNKVREPMKRTLAIALSGVSLLAVTSVSALQLNQHAASWHAARGIDQQFINRSSIGVSNTANVNKVVYGAPARNPHANGNQIVSITGFNNSVNTNTRCTISTVSSLGVPLATKSFCVGSAPGCIVPPAPPAYWIQNTAFSLAEAPSSYSYVAYCTLLPPGVDTNRVHSVRVSP